MRMVEEMIGRAPPDIAASFSAKHLAWLCDVTLAPYYGLPHGFSTSNPENGLQVEPDPAGGLNIVAVTPVMVAWVHDPDGKATKPFVLDVNRKFADACRPPKVPMPFDCNGEPWDVAPPAWMVPDRVTIIAESGADKLPGSRHQLAPARHGYCMVMVQAGELPAGVADADDGATLFHQSGHDYGNAQVVNRRLLPWRDAVAKGSTEPAAEFGVNPEYLSVLCRPGGTMRVRLHGSRGVMLIDYADDPLVHAAIMPSNPTP